MISMFLVNLLVIRFGDERRPVGRLHPRVEANRQDRISGSDRTRCSVVREPECMAFGLEFPRGNSNPREESPSGDSKRVGFAGTRSLRTA